MDPVGGVAPAEVLEEHGEWIELGRAGVDQLRRCRALNRAKSYWWYLWHRITGCTAGELMSDTLSAIGEGGSGGLLGSGRFPVGKAGHRAADVNHLAVSVGAGRPMPGHARAVDSLKRSYSFG